MNLDLFLIQNIFEEFVFSQNYFYLAQLDDENSRMTRNSNPTRIQDNNESPSTINNPSLDPRCGKESESNKHSRCNKQSLSNKD